MPVSGYAYNTRYLKNIYNRLLAYAGEESAVYEERVYFAKYALEFRLLLRKQGSSVQSIIAYLGKDWLYQSVEHFLHKRRAKPLPKNLYKKGKGFRKDYRGLYNGLKFKDLFN